MSVKAILAGQGSGGTETFEAIYGTTTSAEIEAAYQKGQNVVCKYGGRIYPLTSRTSATIHYFSIGAVEDESLIGVNCNNNTWSLLDMELAPLASPALTGTPTAPTAAAGTNTTQLATTEFVQTATSGKLSLSSSALYQGGVDVTSSVASALGAASVTTGSATLPAGTSWTGPDEDTGLYTYTVSISGVTTDSNIHVTPVIDITDADTGNAQQDAWDTHYWSETVNGGIKFYAAEQPGVAVQFAWMVISS